VVALKRAGFAGSRSRTALWEIPTVLSLSGCLHSVTCALHQHISAQYKVNEVEKF
jgi:hypothetical protein